VQKAPTEGIRTTESDRDSEAYEQLKIQPGTGRGSQPRESIAALG